MPSRSCVLMTPVLFVTAASYLCVGTSKAFMLANNRIATSNINTNWRKADNCNKAMVENRFGPGHMISRSSSSSSRGFASETVARPPRVPSAMDHMESSRTSACLLRLQAIFGEVTEVGGGWSSVCSFKPEISYSTCVSYYEAVFGFWT